MEVAGVAFATVEGYIVVEDWNAAWESIGEKS